MATHGDIGLSQPAGSTITHRLDAISLDHNSTVVLREVMVVGSPETTNALTAVLNAAPASTAWGLVTRVADPSTGPFQISSVAGAVVVRSSAANFLGTAYQSTATDLLVTAHGNQSSNSSVYLPVRLSNGTAFITAGTDYTDGSTASNIAGPTIAYDNGSNATMRVISEAMGLPVRLKTSSGGALEGSTTTPAQGVIGVHVRQVVPTLNSTTVVVTSTHSTAIYSLISSVASLRHKVYAYFISSTHTVGSTLIFCSSASGSGFDHWHVGFGSGSSGMTGANLALNPPGFIFAGVSQNALNVKIEGGSSATSTVVARISISWFDEA